VADTLDLEFREQAVDPLDEERLLFDDDYLDPA